VPKTYNGEMITSSTNGAGKTGYLHTEKQSLAQRSMALAESGLSTLI
jgi:hypothetical protein